MKDFFCKLWRNAAAPVTIITTSSSCQSQLAGMTISSLTSVSLGPPKLLVSFNCQSPSRTADILLKRGKVMVNLLSTNTSNVQLAKSFAGRSSSGHQLNPFKKYSKLFDYSNPQKIPMITNCFGNLLCTVEKEIAVQDHNIVVASVDQIWFNEKASPLLYRQHKFLGLKGSSL